MTVKDKFLEVVLAERARLEDQFRQEEARSYYPLAEVKLTRKNGHHPSCLELTNGNVVAFVRLQDIADLEDDLCAILASLPEIILAGQTFALKMLSDLLTLVAWVAQDGLLPE